jgi:hypothetical protein
LPGTSINNPVWKELLKLKIPSKIKIFTWRALHGLLPLKSILVNRHVGTSGECPICHQAPEDIRHLLFQCIPARELWSLLELEEIVDEALVVDLSGSVVLEHVIRIPSVPLHGFQFGLKETAVIACGTYGGFGKKEHMMKSSRLWYNARCLCWPLLQIHLRERIVEDKT